MHFDLVLTLNFANTVFFFFPGWSSSTSENRAETNGCRLFFRTSTTSAGTLSWKQNKKLRIESRISEWIYLKNFNKKESKVYLWNMVGQRTWYEKVIQTFQYHGIFYQRFNHLVLVIFTKSFLLPNLNALGYYLFSNEMSITEHFPQNGRHFTHDFFKCIFVSENVWISLKISL